MHLNTHPHFYPLLGTMVPFVTSDAWTGIATRGLDLGLFSWFLALGNAFHHRICHTPAIGDRSEVSGVFFIFSLSLICVGLKQTRTREKTHLVAFSLSRPYALDIKNN